MQQDNYEYKTVVELIEESRNNIRNSLSLLDKNQLIDLIMIMITHDDKALSITQNFTAKDTDKQEYNQKDILDKIYDDIDNIILFYSDGHRFIPEKYADDWEREIDDYFDAQISILLKKNEIMKAFKLTCHLFEEVVITDVFDDFGNKYIVLDKCGEVWRQLLKVANNTEKDEML